MNLTDLLDEKDLRSAADEDMSDEEFDKERNQQLARLKVFDTLVSELALRAVNAAGANPVVLAASCIQTMLFTIDRALEKKLRASDGGTN